MEEWLLRSKLSNIWALCNNNRVLCQKRHVLHYHDSLHYSVWRDVSIRATDHWLRLNKIDEYEPRVTERLMTGSCIQLRINVRLYRIILTQNVDISRKNERDVKLQINAPTLNWPSLKANRNGKTVRDFFIIRKLKRKQYFSKSVDVEETWHWTNHQYWTSKSFC